MSVAASTDELLITPAGDEQLRAELETLIGEGRRAITARLREARSDGHLDDNPALHDVLEEQVQLERRIAILDRQLAGARIAEPSRDGRVGIGSRVRLRDLDTGELVAYELVGVLEGNVGRGRVSVAAPVGQALAGAAAGDAVTVACPRGTLRFEVVSVDADGAPERKAA